MNIAPEKLVDITAKIEQIVHDIQQQENENRGTWKQVNKVYTESARNLIHYNTFRSYDLRGIQKRLKRLGLSRFANAEGNILGSLYNAHYLLKLLAQKSQDPPKGSYLQIGQGKKRLKKNTNQLFGNKRKGRRVRIMVTQPTAAAQDYQLVLDMVKNGMDCARINCAHDTSEIWGAIIDHVRKAAEECGVDVKIAMDLAGPKIRTGSLGQGPRVQKFKPKRSVLGEVEHPAEMLLVPLEENETATGIPVPKAWLNALQTGDKITLVDTRGKRRKLVVSKTGEHGATVQSLKTFYITTGTSLLVKKPKLGEVQVGPIPATEVGIPLKIGDLLKVDGACSQGSLPELDADGQVAIPGIIPCHPPEVVSRAKAGESVLFDDGKIEGIIKEVHKDHFMVQITKARENGSLLKAEKGINFPTLDMGLSGLTPKDKMDLRFVAQYADIVNYSFVNTDEDVQELLDVLESLDAKDRVSIILKIETRFAYRNLVKILLTAMQTKHIGVMIARGDLALEVGWKNMGKVQDEILSLCSAAHIPVVWATQVLEGLAKRGLPSRSEITDISSSLRAECVMLNKGPHINDAINLLDELLGNMESLHDKKEGMWPKIDWL